ncbi:MAG TPA: hypothetical protein VNK05_03485, partial [Chloroflexota bacterium]|nr:hypothetical protein [Chloroflexota bacterium]
MVIVAGPQLFQVCHWWLTRSRRAVGGSGGRFEATSEDVADGGTSPMVATGTARPGPMPSLGASADGQLPA